jgi:hypothetical protein
MNMFATAKVPNAQDDGSVPVDEHSQPTAWCEHCANEGVCMLEGSTIIGGVTYSRGSAPCPWCMQGQLRYEEWSSPTAIKRGTDKQGGKHVTHHRRFEPASDFTMFDVLATARPQQRSDRFTPTASWLIEREAAGCPRGALMAITPRSVWPAEWRGSAPEPLVGDLGRSDAAEIRRKRQLAIEAKNQAEREQEGSP